MAVNVVELLKVFRTMKNDVAYFFDRNTGSVVQLSSENPDPRLLMAFKAKMDADKKRYIRMPRRSRQEHFADMETFIGTLKDKKLQQRLADALASGGQASKIFRDALESNAMARERWKAFQDERLKGFVVQFLRDNGISA